MTCSMQFSLYEAHNYVEANTLLQGINPADLNQQQQASRAAWLGKAQTAATLQVKAAQDLADAEKDLDAGNLDKAAQRFQAVLDNEYADRAQKDRAGQALVQIREKHQLAQATQEAAARLPRWPLKPRLPNPPPRRPSPSRCRLP